MEIIRTASAGTLESSDVRIEIFPSEQEEIALDIQSDVKLIFGKAIEKTVREVLDLYNVRRVKVIMVDRGALDCTIRARLACAICRASKETSDPD